MPSTFTTDPIGPRSVDEMLGVVYTRADRLRRRRTGRRLGAAAVAVLLGAAAVATSGRGDPDAHVRAADRSNTALDNEAAPPAADAEAATAGAAAGGSVRSGSSAKPKGAAKPNEVDATVKRPEAVPALPADDKPALEMWADDADVLNDSTPGDWYFDIVSTSMEFDAKANVVVFTTAYRLPAPAEAGTRAGRLLESIFDYDNTSFSVKVEESDNRLGAVRLDNTRTCTDCVAEFHADRSTLVLHVPLGSLNAAVTRRASPLAPGADIWSIHAVTFKLDPTLGPQKADDSSTGL